MRILVDADGTNRIAPAIDIAKKYKIPIKLFCDCSHILHSNYAEIATPHRNLPILPY